MKLIKAVVVVGSAAAILTTQAQAATYVSYGALSTDQVTKSSGSTSTTYTRGCSSATKCARTG